MKKKHFALREVHFELFYHIHCIASSGSRNYPEQPSCNFKRICTIFEDIIIFWKRDSKFYQYSRSYNLLEKHIFITIYYTSNR